MFASLPQAVNSFSKTSTNIILL